MGWRGMWESELREARKAKTEADPRNGVLVSREHYCLESCHERSILFI